MIGLVTVCLSRRLREEDAFLTVFETVKMSLVEDFARMGGLDVVKEEVWDGYITLEVKATAQEAACLLGRLLRAYGLFGFRVSGDQDEREYLWSELSPQLHHMLCIA